MLKIEYTVFVCNYFLGKIVPCPALQDPIYGAHSCELRSATIWNSSALILRMIILMTEPSLSSPPTPQLICVRAENCLHYFMDSLKNLCCLLIYVCCDPFFAGVKLMKTQKLSTRASKYKQNRARWYLIYTLLHNPSLLPYRKRALSEAKANGTQTNPLKVWRSRKSLYETLIVWGMGEDVCVLIQCTCIPFFSHVSHSPVRLSWCHFITRLHPTCLKTKACFLKNPRQFNGTKLAVTCSGGQPTAGSTQSHCDFMNLYLPLPFKLPLQNFPFSLSLFMEVWKSRS